MSHTLHVDMIACDGRGICADLLPERITLDDWGYPIIDPTPIDRQLLAHARRSVTNCPTLALRLTPITVRRGNRRPGCAAAPKSPSQRG